MVLRSNLFLRISLTEPIQSIVTGPVGTLGLNDPTALFASTANDVGGNRIANRLLEVFDLGGTFMIASPETDPENLDHPFHPKDAVSLLVGGINTAKYGLPLSADLDNQLRDGFAVRVGPYTF